MSKNKSLRCSLPEKCFVYYLCRGINKKHESISAYKPAVKEQTNLHR
jgi:hypothetical protein